MIGISFCILSTAHGAASKKPSIDITTSIRLIPGNSSLPDYSIKSSTVTSSAYSTHFQAVLIAFEKSNVRKKMLSKIPTKIRYPLTFETIVEHFKKSLDVADLKNYEKLTFLLALLSFKEKECVWELCSSIDTQKLPPKCYIYRPPLTRTTTLISFNLKTLEATFFSEAPHIKELLERSNKDPHATPAYTKLWNEHLEMTTQAGIEINDQQIHIIQNTNNICSIL
jgi:hypothetical protein